MRPKHILAAITFYFLALSSLHAKVYIKGFVGKNNNNQVYQSTRFQTGPTLTDYTEAKLANRLSDWMTGGSFGFVAGSLFSPKFRPGFELSILKNEGKNKINIYNGDNASEQTYSDWESTILEVDNDYRVDATLLFEVKRIFYFKIGGSYLKQNIKSRTYESDDLTRINDIITNESEGFWGGVFGAGLKFNIFKGFGMFTEMNSTFYNKKRLSTVFFNAANSISFPDPDVSTTEYDRKLNFNQTQFITGIFISSW